MALLQNSSIINGSMLQVFVDNDTPLAFATSHSLNVSTSTTEVTTKSHGSFPAIIPQSVSWEVTAENLYTEGSEQTFLDYQTRMTPLNIKFAKVGNYNEKGIVAPNGVDTAWTAGTNIASGQAYVTNVSVNAPAGDNATLSVTFTGIGALALASDSNNNAGGNDNNGDNSSGESGAQGSQGASGTQGSQGLDTSGEP